MIDCANFRRALLADPGDPDPRLRAHREDCPECARFAQGLARFEQKLERAMRVRAGEASRTVPARAPRRVFGGRPFGGRNRLALAASLALGFVAAAALWLAVPRPTLAEDVVAHMAEEPQAWLRTAVAVPPPALRAVLRDAHVRLSPGAGLVTYANSCLFRGHQVPHFVVQGERGPVTVMILVHESVARPRHFDEQGYRGVILPVPGHGAMAVLTRGAGGDAASVERTAKRLLAAIVWTA